MNIDEWLYSQLNTITSVEGRVTPEIGDADETKPYIVYRLITEEPIVTHNLQNMTTRHWSYQICCYDRTDALARALADLAKAVLLDQSATGIQSVVPMGSRKEVDLDTRDHGFSFDVSIWENLA